MQKNNLNIQIDVSFIFKPKCGIGVYVDTLIKCLSSLNITPGIISFEYPKMLSKIKYWLYIIYLNTIFYVKTFITKPDVIIFPTFFMPYLKRKKTKYITVIHDLCGYRPGLMSKWGSRIMKINVWVACRKADIIVTVSDTVKNELIERFNINPDRIMVIHNAIAEYFIDSENKPNVLGKYNIESGKYIFSVATLNKNKNIPSLIKAFESISDKYPDLKLVLVGGMGNEDRVKITKHPNIIFTGYIQDEEIPELYKNTMIYVSPSLYEGFGIPIIEAQYTGCPLLCSDIPVFHDIAGNGAEFTKTDSESISEKLEFLINNPSRRKDLTELEKENVKRFDIENVTEQLKNVLDKAYKGEKE